MNFEGAERIIHRWIVTRRPGQKIPPLVRQAYDWAERKAQAAGPNTAPDRFNLAWLARDEIMERGKGYQKRAGIREQIADYIDRVIVPHTRDFTFYKVISRLRDARKTGTWGTRANGDLVTIWDDKSGLLRLDPDEAREETQRLAERYIPALIEKSMKGAGVHYAVFTLPNFAAGELAKGQRDIYRKFSNLLRAQLNKEKLFPDILGALCVVEAPLAAHRDSWNVHMNVLLVTRSKFCPGLYKRLRDKWYWNVEIRPAKADVGSLAKTFNELVKYSTQSVPDKSIEKARTGKSKAPALTEWPADRFVEWFKAQHRYRRTRTYGCLYGKKVPKPEPSTLDDVTWHGVVRCDSDRFYAQQPLIDLIPGDKSTTQRHPQSTTDPPH